MRDYFCSFWATSIDINGKKIFFKISSSFKLLFMKNAVLKFYQKSYLLLYSFTVQMVPKLCKYVDQERQNNFSCKRENTLKSMVFATLWTLIWHVTVSIYLYCHTFSRTHSRIKNVKNMNGLHHTDHTLV